MSNMQQDPGCAGDQVLPGTHRSMTVTGPKMQKRSPKNGGGLCPYASHLPLGGKKKSLRRQLPNSATRAGARAPAEPATSPLSPLAPLLPAPLAAGSRGGRSSPEQPIARRPASGDVGAGHGRCGLPGAGCSGGAAPFPWADGPVAQTEPLHPPL